MNVFTIEISFMPLCCLLCVSSAVAKFLHWPSFFSHLPSSDIAADLEVLTPPCTAVRWALENSQGFCCCNHALHESEIAGEIAYLGTDREDLYITDDRTLAIGIVSDWLLALGYRLLESSWS